MVPTDELEGFSKRPRLVRTAAVLAGMVAAAAAVFFATRPAPQQNELKRLPDFRLARLDGSGALTMTDVIGKPAVVNFWASWCTSCRYEAPAFEKAWRKYRGQVQFVGVDICDLANEARRFVKEYGLTYTIVRDPDRTLARKLGVQECRLPVTVFVDSSGRFAEPTAGEPVGEIRGTTVLGPLSPSELESKIQDLLEPAA